VQPLAVANALSDAVCGFPCSRRNDITSFRFEANSIDGNVVDSQIPIELASLKLVVNEFDFQLIDVSLIRVELERLKLFPNSPQANRSTVEL